MNEWHLAGYLTYLTSRCFFFSSRFTNTIFNEAISAEQPGNDINCDCYLRGITVMGMCQMSHFKVISLPLSCQCLIRWSGVLSPAPPLYKTSRINVELTQTLLGTDFCWVKSQWHIDWLPVLWCIQGPFSSVHHCINIVVQTSLQAHDWNPRVPQLSWHVKILSYVDTFAINWRLCSALPPLFVEGLSFKQYRSPQTHSTHSKCNKNWVSRRSESTPQIIRSWKSRISRVWSSCLHDLETAQILERNTPLAHGLWLRGGQIS